MKIIYRYLIVISGLFVVGCFFDWRIDVDLYNPSSSYGLLFQAIGGVPVALVPLIACNYIAFNSKYKFFYGASLILSVGIVKSVLDDFIDLPWLIILIIAAIFYIVILFGISKIKNSEYLIRVSYMIIILALSLVTVTEITKWVWARPRFIANDGFSPWYKINFAPQSDLYKSFFSGHTANSLMLLPLSLAFSTKIKQNIAIIISLTFGTMTAISRLILGKHYLTDVCMGAIVSICLFLILKKVFKLQYKE